MSEEVQQERQRLMTQLELQQITQQRAQAVFADTMAYANNLAYSLRMNSRLGQGMCRPGWTGNMWKEGKRP